MAGPELAYRDLATSDQGILARILTRCYQPLKDLNEYSWVPADDTWQAYDAHIFEDLINTDEQIFLTEREEEVVAFASFAMPGNQATIGRNAVLPEHGGIGIGTCQVEEIVRRCRASQIESICVLTGVHPFFSSAQRMYIKAGFHEVERMDDGSNVGRILIRYRLDLTVS